ncbi:hypothetical protein CFIMG_008300RA00001 [Ceratocystis fimbriata CBS 114723]|uniref:ASX DEUBAD domain-containing protein n=1 Tax=Ceratocystis fimbriata CBS 114723 TaxID=1035309 RepID=A0A2C5XIC8_9PEZI|nr:hypothetical protein CFIMG_008300RA00001 [Ceratocystis fimbriata CBS 114723]
MSSSSLSSPPTSPLPSLSPTSEKTPTKALRKRPAQPEDANFTNLSQRPAKMRSLPFIKEPCLVPISSDSLPCPTPTDEILYESPRPTRAPASAPSKASRKVLSTPAKPFKQSAIPPTSRRVSARQAINQSKIAEYSALQHADRQEVPVTSSLKPKQTSRNRAPKKKAPAKRNNAWGMDNVFTSVRSPLIKANLREIFLLGDSWDCLPQDKKDKITSLFPGGDKYLSIQPDGSRRPNVVALRSNNSFRYDVTRYQENIHLGRHNQLWLEDAWAAHHRRIQGFYDDALEDKVNSDWGVDVNVNTQTKSQGEINVPNAPEKEAESQVERES